jgi:hypothetical protein
VIPAPVLAALVVAVLAVGSGDGDPATGEQGLPTGTEPVVLDPEEFTTRIGNPYLPMTPGDRRVYRITDSDGLRQRSVATVTDETKPIANGVTARVVYTVVREVGKRVEDNHAWYAQDSAGNVWYLGERAREFEHGKVATTKGSWEAGVDGALPGVVMPANPRGAGQPSPRLTSRGASERATPARCSGR